MNKIQIVGLYFNLRPQKKQICNLLQLKKYISGSTKIEITFFLVVFFFLPPCKISPNLPVLVNKKKTEKLTLYLVAFDIWQCNGPCRSNTSQLSNQILARSCYKNVNISIGTLFDSGLCAGVKQLPRATSPSRVVCVCVYWGDFSNSFSCHNSTSSVHSFSL